MSQLKAGHAIDLLECGAAFFPALVAAIDASHTEVRLETYIFAFEASGESVAMALVRAATRGVAVYLVMDGIGTPHIPQVWVQRFALAGVLWHQFSPLGRLGLLIPGRWRRMHRKLCAVDGRIAFCGGINIVDDLQDPNYGILTYPRFDFAVRVQGPLVADVQTSMAQFWLRLQVTRGLDYLQFKKVRLVLRGMLNPPKLPRAKSDEGGSSSDQSLMAALILRDNLRNRNRIERAYYKALGEARQEVLIANAYFVPGAKMRRALINAARRGVRVRLLLHGSYEYFMQYHAAKPFYGALLAAGVQIYEYKPGFLHAKVAVVDGHWATVGSSNLDPLSLQLAREANVVVDNEIFAAELQQRLELAIVRSGAPLDPKTYAARPWQQRVRDQFAFGLMRVILFLTGRRY